MFQKTSDALDSDDATYSGIKLGDLVRLASYTGWQSNFLWDLPRGDSTVGVFHKETIGLVVAVDQLHEDDVRLPVVTPWVKILAEDGQMGWMPDYAVMKIPV